MKKFALSFLYVFSIVLAVGIGMAQVGKEGKVQGRQAPPDCDTIRIDSFKCDLLANNKGDKNCSSTATCDSKITDETHGIRTILTRSREGSSLCGGCNHTPPQLETVTVEPKCTEVKSILY